MVKKKASAPELIMPIERREGTPDIPPKEGGERKTKGGGGKKKSRPISHNDSEKQSHSHL